MKQAKKMSPGHLARSFPRLLASVGRRNIGGFEGWQETRVRLLNSSQVSQAANLRPQTAETSPEAFKENPVKEALAGPSLADISKDVSYR